ncbi:hypothetical protein Leryth_023254, partial [Lithospermum erythrorhizon]
REAKAPKLRTRSRHLGESPATFPSAQTACQVGHSNSITVYARKGILPNNACSDVGLRCNRTSKQECKTIKGNQYMSVHCTCSRTSSLEELRSLTKIGTAPWSMTALVLSDVPDAILWDSVISKAKTPQNEEQPQTV